MIRKNIKSILLVVICSMALVIFSQESVQAAKKASLSSKKLSVEVGKTKTLKIKNTNKKVTWKVVSGKNKISITKKGKKAVTIKGKSVGAAKVQASVGSKKLSCAVTVKDSVEKTPEKEDTKEPEKEETKEPENTSNSAEEDVAALKQLIAEQKEAGAGVSIGMGSSQYKWNSEGRLVGINWKHCNLTGKISFAAFPCLEELDCSDNYRAISDDSIRYCLKGIDVSKNAALKILKCSANEFSDLNISNNIVLQTLKCSDNDLSHLDISANTELKELDCSVNELSNLDISVNTKLVELNCSRNCLNSLDISTNDKLKELSINGQYYYDDDGDGVCPLDTLILDNAISLEVLDCSNNVLSNLDISVNTKLVKLNCSRNHLKSLDISTNDKLKELSISGQWYDDDGDAYLDTLILDNAVSLEVLDCSGNALSNLDISVNTKLIELKCSGNCLNSLDISANTKLVKLNCSRNHLKSLDISTNDKLKELYINGQWYDDGDDFENTLNTLILDNAVSLEVLDCSDNGLLEELDLGDCRYLKTLNASDTSLQKVTLSDWFMEFPESVTIIGCDKSVISYTSFEE